MKLKLASLVSRSTLVFLLAVFLLPACAGSKSRTTKTCYSYSKRYYGGGQSPDVQHIAECR